jgi:hypothetical protein
MAVSLATPTFSEPVNPHPYSLGYLPSLNDVTLNFLKLTNKKLTIQDTTMQIIVGGTIDQGTRKMLGNGSND